METVKIWLSTLNTSKRAGKKAPHKAILLLSIMELIEEGIIKESKVALSDKLIDKFDEIWSRLVKDKTFNCNIAAPYWHMRSEPFWRIIARQGKEPNPNSLKSLQEDTIACIDYRLYKFLEEQEGRKAIKEILLRNYLYSDTKNTDYMHTDNVTTNHRLSELESHITWLRSHGYEVPAELEQHYNEEKAEQENLIIKNKLTEFIKSFVAEHSIADKEISVIFNSDNITISINGDNGKTYRRNDKEKDDDNSIRSYKHGVLRISLPDGTVFQSSKSVETLIEFIKYVGVEKVASLNIKRNGEYLVSRTPSVKYANSQKHIGDGWYVMGNTSTKYKVIDAEYISKSFNLGAVIETFSE